MKPKPQSEEYTRFENLLGEVLTVSKEELNRRMEADKCEKRTPKAPASRVSDERSNPS
jgi:hypothetical protein